MWTICLTCRLAKYSSVCYVIFCLYILYYFYLAFSLWCQDARPQRGKSLIAQNAIKANTWPKQSVEFYIYGKICLEMVLSLACAKKLEIIRINPIIGRYGCVYSTDGTKFFVVILISIFWLALNQGLYASETTDTQYNLILYSI